MTTDNSTDLSVDEGGADDPEASEVRPAARPDGDEVEGRSRNNPALPDDESDDAEGHNGKWS